MYDPMFGIMYTPKFEVDINDFKGVKLIWACLGTLNKIDYEFRNNSNLKLRFVAFKFIYNIYTEIYF
jgi:hypothetical protein